jgi:hypothetical protein
MALGSDLKIINGKLVFILEQDGIEIGEAVPIDIDDEQIKTKRTNAKLKIEASNIINMTYADLDQYIEDNITDLTSAKEFLKKLATVVLAMLKRQNWSD